MINQTRTKPLAELGLRAIAGQETEITGISVDSRRVLPGHLFGAFPGSNAHGAEYIQYALRMDAAAILTDKAGAEIAKDEIAAAGVPVILTEDPRQAMAYTAALWYGAQPENMVAITGTNGKTSVATFVRQIWTLMGIQAANLGTTGVEGAFTAPLAHTTPEPTLLHRLLAEMAGAGITHCAMEASSHGLEQRRLDGVRLKAAGFTNFSQDHLDYHKTFEAYFEAKAGLFSRVLPDDATAVVNIMGAEGETIAELAAERGQKLITIGVHHTANLRITAHRLDHTGQDLRFEWQGKVYQTRLKLIGGFQMQNALMAAALVIACGGDADEVFETMRELKPVRGRMQLAATRSNGAAVYVDFAHTPDAVETALQSLRPHVMGRIIVVLGAGGDRDPGKRVLMGHAAADNADVVFVTDDNPRSEDPASIRDMVMQGCPHARNVADRAEAILRGVDALQVGDALLIAGKGHETGQIVGDDILPFDDVEQASVAVAALEGGPV